MNSRRACGANIILVITLFLTLYSLPSVSARPTVHTVGGDYGWTFDVRKWTKGKKFKAGDILSFNYDPSFHNVVAVDVRGYRTCTASSKSKIYRSGKDRLKLLEGRHYFICNIPGHCEEGMKIEVDVLGNTK
ncbi:Basic blue protein [Morella rubra]|uniref:Basic blue protein n=1 Tax=Morella rubra TaxID=262757 RepID=A0A6A1VBN7_9ROSI|nr:Basic blue protein [Morella rubra]